jgi:hypothetical protein
VKILLTEFQLKELKNLAQILGGQPYLDPQTGKQVHAIEDTTVAALMKSSALGTCLKFKLNLKEHPERGYFVETHVSDKTITPPEYDGTQCAFTAICYLLVGEQFSSFQNQMNCSISVLAAL